MAIIKSENQQVNILQYPFQRDISYRIYLSKISEDELSILQEVINGSLQGNIRQIAEYLEIEIDIVKSVLATHEDLSLLKINQLQYTIDREARKCFEIELQKLSSRFEPSIQYLQELLNKVPIHLLPEWYEIPRSTDNIMSAIFDRYFLSPKNYAIHLEEVARKRPDQYSMYRTLTQTPECYLPSEAIMQKLSLTQEEFHRFALEMEFSFLACLCYKPIENGWQVGLAIPHEWQEFNRFGKTNTYHSLDENQVHRLYEEDFGFLRNFNMLCEQKLDGDTEVSHHLFEDLLLQDTRDLVTWLKKSYMDQASLLYSVINRNNSAWNEKDVRKLENALRAISRNGWILFEDFICYSKVLLSGKPPIELVAKGKKWHYSTPKYSEEDIELVKTLFRDLFVPVGMIALGTYNKQMCFCVTPYGKSVLAF